MNPKTNFIKSVWLKSLLVVPAIILILTVFSLSASGQKSTTTKTEVATPPPPPPPPPPPSPPSSNKKAATGMTNGAYQVVDIMPVFPGGDEALLNYIADSTRYPEEAKEKGLQGKVIARFMVKKNGSVSNVSIIKGVNALLDNEAIRVVKALPKFTPGKLNGKTVPVWYMIPISFTLK